MLDLGLDYAGIANTIIESWKIKTESVCDLKSASARKIMDKLMQERMRICYKIEGRIPSKKNTIYIGKYRQVYQAKSSELLSIIFQLKKQKKSEMHITPVCVSYYINSHSKRQDMSNIMATIDDCLEKAEIIKNDRLIQQIGFAEIQFKKSEKEGAVVSVEKISISKPLETFEC